MNVPMLCRNMFTRWESDLRFESSVNSYDSQTLDAYEKKKELFESSVNSYDSQTIINSLSSDGVFESSVNSYDSQTYNQHTVP